MPAVFSIGALGEIRTPDHLVRSQVLYPTELRAPRCQERDYADLRRLRQRFCENFLIFGMNQCRSHVLW